MGSGQLKVGGEKKKSRWKSKNWKTMDTGTASGVIRHPATDWSGVRLFARVVGFIFEDGFFFYPGKTINR